MMRVWPALVKLATKIGARWLDRHDREHTASGAHRTIVSATTVTFSTLAPVYLSVPERTAAGPST
jgi:hypothetical protein